MKLLPLLLVIVIVFTGFIDTKDNKDIFKRLEKLQGTWMMHVKPGVVLFECWQKENDTLLHGKSYVLRGIEMKAQENVSLIYNREGVFYIPVVENQNNGQAVSFKLTSSAANEFVFENPQHDFPKRIVYTIVSEDVLNAVVDDGAGTSKKINYHYQKIKQQ